MIPQHRTGWRPNRVCGNIYRIRHSVIWAFYAGLWAGRLLSDGPAPLRPNRALTLTQDAARTINIATIVQKRVVMRARKHYTLLADSSVGACTGEYAGAAGATARAMLGVPPSCTGATARHPWGAATLESARQAFRGTHP